MATRSKQANLKTKKTDADVGEFLEKIPDHVMKSDCQTLVKMFKKLIKDDPKMWGPSIIGFGHYHYKYESGLENDWFVAGFSPRKKNITVYLMGGLSENEDLLEKLGKHKRGKGCLYINRLADIDTAVLSEMITRSAKRLVAKK